MKKLLLLTAICVSAMAHTFAQTQLTLSVTVTNATACTPPCNGSATVASVTGGTPPYTYLWNIPFAPQQTQTATGLCPGQYQVGVFDAGSPFPGQGQQLVTITCSATGMYEVSTDASINTFPNPAEGILNLEIGNITGSSEIVITNILGMTVYTQKVESNGYVFRQVDVSSFPTGTYAVQFMNEEKAIRTKFVKQ